MATSIVNFERARTAFMPILFIDADAAEGDESDVEFWLKLLPEGQRELTAETAPDLVFLVDYRAPTESLKVGWTIFAEVEDAAALLVARHYQLGGRRISTNEPFPTDIVKIKEL